MLKEKITDKLNDYLRDTAFYLVDIKTTPQDKIMVFVDGEKNITIEKCIEISRMLEEYLEGENLVRDNYILEVSSPGMGQPFKVKQQYFKSIGRGIEILKKDGVKLKGILKNVEAGNVQLQIDEKKKGKVVRTEYVDVAFDDIKTTKQLITFK